MTVSSIPRDLWWRPLRVWIFLSWLAAWGLQPEGTRSLETLEIVACLLIGATLAGMGAQSALFLGLARRGSVTHATTAPCYRLWKFAPGAVLWGGLGGIPGVALGALTASVGWPRFGLLLGANLVVIGAFWMLRRKLARDLEKPWSPREASLQGWLFWDTAVPAGFLAALLAAGIAWLRLGHLPWVHGATLARHLGGTLLLYSFLLGPTGAIKVGRERLSGMVKAPQSRRELPGPILAGCVFSLVMLVVGPRLLPALRFVDALIVKVLFSAVFGCALTYLGALRGARAHEYKERRSSK